LLESDEFRIVHIDHHAVMIDPRTSLQAHTPLETRTALQAHTPLEEAPSPHFVHRLVSSDRSQSIDASCQYF
ncbi:MAG TPA: hypothetical protein VFB54_02170, partial [Burkholderiales bacterium]|nr:hypothetical protein [Burkholderiales bacterium]